MKKTLLFCLILLCASSILNSQTTFSALKSINASTGANPYVIDSGDLDADLSNPLDANKSIDIVIGTYSGNTIEWYKNDGSGNFTLQTLIASTITGISGIEIADLNGDNYNDIIASSYPDDKLVWYANDGAGGFGSEQTISSSINGGGTVVSGTIDAGATIDVAVVAYDSGDTVWFSNDGSGNFSGPYTIASVASSGPADLDLADFDGDGDLDAVIANGVGKNIELYDNRLIPDGSVSFVKYDNSVDTGNVNLFDVSFADVNDDTVLDIIKSDYGAPGEVAYYTKNSAGTSTTFSKTIITTAMSIQRPATATVADLDNDTKNDVVSSNAASLGNDLEWFESTDVGTFNTVATIDDVQQIVYGVTINDFDADGDLDIASFSYYDSTLNWFENYLINPPLGLDENEPNKISIFPNPAKNQLYFKGFSQNFEVLVYDIVGKNILDETMDANASLDVSKLKSGIYILKFKDYDSTFKLVKE